MMETGRCLRPQVRPTEREPVTEPPTFPRPSPADPAERSPSASRRPFARLVAAPTARRLARGRLALVLLAALAAAALLALTARFAGQATAGWLYQRPEWLVRFDAITLDPPPPPWIKLSAAGLLEQVRLASGRPETLSVPAIDLAELAADFQRDAPWVRSVRAIDRSYPNTLVVRLEYRRPAAFLRTRERRLTIDRDGVVLPESEIDRGASGRLVELALADPAGPPVEARAGRVLKFGEGAGASPEGMERIPFAANLCGFLFDRQGVGPAPLVPRVIAVQLQQASLWLDLEGPCQVLWSARQGRVGELSDERKWQALQEWFEQHRASTLRHPAYLAFERTRAVVVGGSAP